jgi:hypothetical protein
MIVMAGRELARQRRCAQQIRERWPAFLEPSRRHERMFFDQIRKVIN